jgi:hypothetical protein
VQIEMRCTHAHAHAQYATPDLGLGSGAARRQRLVLDGDALRRVLREIGALGDDEGDRVAYEHRPVPRKGRARRNEHR